MAMGEPLQNPYEASLNITRINKEQRVQQGLYDAVLLGPVLAGAIGAVQAAFTGVTWHLDGQSAIIPDRIIWYLGFIVVLNIIMGLFLGVVNAIVIKGMSMRIPVLLYSSIITGLALVIFGITAYRESTKAEAELFSNWMFPMASVYLSASVLTLVLSVRK